MSRRFVAGMLFGLMVGLGVSSGAALVMDARKSPPRYALVTSFQPDETWTREYAAKGVAALTKKYDAAALDGFRGKHFLANFEKNEFGGFYQFDTMDDLETFMTAFPPEPNRTVKIYEIVGHYPPVVVTYNETMIDATKSE
ncbi:MAG: hypothetical protein O3A46_09870 [Candidatus Poribacteria bacterium]|nr:hypothetical protein [Candidatus Poribacteria bacterium]